MWQELKDGVLAAHVIATDGLLVTTDRATGLGKFLRLEVEPDLDLQSIIQQQQGMMSQVTNNLKANAVFEERVAEAIEKSTEAIQGATGLPGISPDGESEQ